MLLERLNADLYTAVLALLASAAASVVLSVIIYRTFFHPLAKYPGPLLGKITDWYSVYHVLNGDRHYDTYKLHQKYGDVVRFGPNRISVNTTSALHGIYGAKTNLPKFTFYNGFRNFFEAPATATIIDKSQHGFRRRVISQALTTTSIKGMETSMLDSIGAFCDKLLEKEDQENTRSDQEWSTARNMTDWFARLTFDIVGDLCFGRNWNVVNSERNRAFLKIIPDGLAGLLLASHMPAILTFKVDLIFFRKLTKSARQFENITKCQLQYRTQAFDDGSTKHDDVFEKLLGARDEETGKGLTSAELNSELIGLIVAGSDTTATTLTATKFYLLHYPSTLVRLRVEIDQIFSTVEEILIGPQLSSCAYLRACLDEAMRLNPATGGILPREVPNGGLTIDGNFFPAGTDIGISLYTLHHRQEYFVNVSVFAPERWLGDKVVGVSPEGLAAFSPFSIGPRGCPGKAMAYNEMMLTLARMVFLFDMRLKDNHPQLDREVEEAVQFETLDCFTSRHDGPMVQFRKRTR